MYRSNGRVSIQNPGGDQRTGYHPNVTRRHGYDLLSMLTAGQPGPTPSRDGSEGGGNSGGGSGSGGGGGSSQPQAPVPQPGVIASTPTPVPGVTPPQNNVTPTPSPVPDSRYNNVNIVRGDTVDINNSSANGYIDQSAYVDNSVSTTIGNDNVFGDNETIGENNANTSINQVAQDFLADTMQGLNIGQNVKVDNSVDTEVGDRNTFGDGLRLGNNYAETDINQDATYSLDLGDLKKSSGGQARERSRNWLKTRS